MAEQRDKAIKELNSLLRDIARDVLSSERSDNGLLEEPYRAGGELAIALHTVESAAWDRLDEALRNGRLPTPEPDLEPLLSWVVLNPIGPSLIDLYSIPVPRTKHTILTSIVTHPILPDAIVYAVLPRRSRPELPNEWHLVLRQLFGSNGAGDETLIGCIPDAVGVQTNSCLSGATAKELLWTALQADRPDVVISEHHVRRKIAQMFMTWTAPAEQLSLEMDDAALESHPLVLGDETRHRKVDQHTFEVWWTLATHPARQAAVIPLYWKLFEAVQDELPEIFEN